MKGLLRKDFYMTAKYCRVYLLILLLIGGITLFTLEDFGACLYPCLLIGALPINMYVYDEREKWCSYGMTMPISRTQYVTAKYLYGLCCLVVMLVFTAVVSGVRLIVFKGVTVVGEYTNLFPLLMIIGLLPSTLAFPLMFKLGAEKGRLIYPALIGVCSSVFVVLGLSDFQGFRQINGAMIVAAVLLLHYLSWRLSIRFYQRREL